jgi:hypothetical protein
MSESPIIGQPPAYGAERDSIGIHMGGFRGFPASGASQQPDISAALATLQLEHADISTLANANRLLAARFLAIALNEERNARLMSHRLEMAVVRDASYKLIG